MAMTDVAVGERSQNAPASLDGLSEGPVLSPTPTDRQSLRDSTYFLLRTEVPDGREKSLYSGILTKLHASLG